MFQIGDLTFYNWKKGRSWIGGNERWEVNTFYLEKYQYCHHFGQGVRSDICQCIGQGGGSGRELLVSTPWHWHQGGSQCHCKLTVEGGRSIIASLMKMQQLLQMAITQSYIKRAPLTHNGRRSNIAMQRQCWRWLQWWWKIDPVLHQKVKVEKKSGLRLLFFDLPLLKPSWDCYHFSLNDVWLNIIKTFQQRFVNIK